MDSVNIFWGSDEKFSEKTIQVNNPCGLIDIFNHINKTEVAVAGVGSDELEPLQIENLIINTDDYGAIKEWALMGFSSNILQNSKLNVNNLWLNNPPLKIYRDIIRTYCEIVKEEHVIHESVTLEKLKQIASQYNENVLGQNNVIKRIVCALYLLNNNRRKQPVSILFLGDSGVGKTETAKYISKSLNQDMVRVQFSMQQTADAYKFIFGSDHGEDSLARELIRRPSNVVLLDEFDKVHPSFYNAFYQMFDEGVFVDSNYSVNIEKCIIICTTNYTTEAEAEKHLGTPIYSRFSKVIKFNDISKEDRVCIASKIFDSLYERCSTEEKNMIVGNNILNTFTDAIAQGAYKNIRMLKNDIEDAINFEILKSMNIIE